MQSRVKVEKGRRYFEIVERRNQRTNKNVRIIFQMFKLNYSKNFERSETFSDFYFFLALSWFYRIRKLRNDRYETELDMRQ